MDQQVDPTDWAVVELFGHVRTAGRVSEVERYGGKMMRLDVPSVGGFLTQFLGHSSLYRVTITDEPTARWVAAQASPLPVTPWEIRHALEAPPADSWPGPDGWKPVSDSNDLPC